MSLKEEIQKTVQKYGKVRFARLDKIPGFKGESNYLFGAKDYVLWPMSFEAITVLGELEAEKKIVFEVSSTPSYSMRGKCLNLKDRKLHWARIVWKASK